MTTILINGIGQYQRLYIQQNDQTPNVSEYSHIFTDAGYSDISLTVTSQHGCSDTQDSTEVVLLNTYTMTITGSDTICFNGLSEVTQDFSVDILQMYQTYHIILKEALTWV